jgi:hypothetical protein
LDTSFASTTDGHTPEKQPLLDDDIEMISENLERKVLVKDEVLDALKRSCSYANNEISNYSLSITKIGGTKAV